MTRKHFILIANILKAYHKSVAMGWAYDINEAFADLCESESTQFDRQKFLEDCEPKKENIGSYCEDCGQFQNDYPTIQCTNCGAKTIEREM